MDADASVPAAAATPQASPPGHAAAGARRQWGRWAVALVGAAGLLGIVARFASAVAVHPLLGYGLAFGAVAGQTVLASWAVRRPTPRVLALIALPVAAVYGVYLSGATGAAAAMLVTVGLLAAGTLLGAHVGAGIEHPGHLLFVALVSSGMDALSVLHPRGLSAAIVRSEAALSVLAMSWPLLGTDTIAPILGVGDVIFTALYLGASRKHGLPVRRTLWALAVAYLATYLLVVTVQLPVPALPLLGLAVVLAHPAARRPRASDRRAGWLGVGVLASVGVVLFLTR